MIYLPPLRRYLLPALIVLAVVTFYKSRLRPSAILHPLDVQRQHAPSEVIRIPIKDLKQHRPPFANGSASRLPPSAEPNRFYTKQPPSVHSNGSIMSPIWARPVLNPHLDPLFRCPTQPNHFTKHIRLQYIVQNISMVPPNPQRPEDRIFWNPTVISLPYWSENQYLLVSRILTEGHHQKNLLCEASICHNGNVAAGAEGDLPCMDEDLKYLGPSGGLRCRAEPSLLNVPPTPAERCDGKYRLYVDIPGFHDPRIFWSGRGEPLMMVNSQSRYACFGLWAIDLRTLHLPLKKLLESSPGHPSFGPLMSYPTLTELTRNPPADRSPIEKNWMLFFPGSEAYVQYEISPRGGRTFAKLLGNGLTSTNLTDPEESPCLFDVDDNEPDERRKGGSWHQTTNSLRLVLCERTDVSCKPSLDNTVFFAVVHRKHSNALGLPMRYERYFIVWSATAPFNMLAVSQYPIQMANETATGWSAAENWDGDSAALEEGRGMWAYFTYTTTIAYAWGRKGDEAFWKGTGYLDDVVVVSIGVDDMSQGFARVPAKELLQCMRACPGRI